MKFSRILSTLLIVSVVLAAFLVPSQVEAGKKKMLKKAALTALLLKGGKKILLPLPIPIPIPFLKQKQPIYYEQPSYSSYGSSSGSSY